MTWPMGGGKDPGNVYWDYTYSNVSGTVSALKQPGVLGSILINGGTMGLLTITDNTGSTGGNIIAQFTPSVSGEFFEFSTRCKKGCSIFASAATAYTVTYLS